MTDRLPEKSLTPGIHVQFQVSNSEEENSQPPITAALDLQDLSTKSMRFSDFARKLQRFPIRKPSLYEDATFLIERVDIIPLSVLLN